MADRDHAAVRRDDRGEAPLGRSLTDVASLPPGAERSLSDPFAENRPKWPKRLFFLVILGAIGFGLWKTGHISHWFKWVPEPKEVWYLGDFEHDGPK